MATATQATKWEDIRAYVERVANNVGWDFDTQIREAFGLAKSFKFEPDFPGISIHFSDSTHPYPTTVYLGVVRLPQPPNCKRAPEGERESNVAHAIAWAKSYSRFNR